jgi:hypothetical protein
VIESCGCLWEEEKGEEREKSLDAWEELVVCSRRLGLAADWRMGITCGRQSPSSRAEFSTEGRAASDQDPEFYIWGSRDSRLLFTSLALFVYSSAGRSDEQPNLCSTRIVSISLLIVFWHSTDGFSILPSAIAVAGLYQHQQRPWPPPWPKASRACWTRTASAKLRRTPAKTV